MRSVLVASSKGGCGKTTLVTNLASCLAQRGRNVALIDSDPQGSSLHWCEKRPESVPGVLGMQVKHKKLDLLPQDTDWVLVDSAAGSTVASLQHWLDQVDAVLVPVLPSAIDLEATLPFLGELSRVSKVRRGKLPVGLVANRLKPWTRASQEALGEMDEFRFPLVAELRDSQAYVLLTSLGKGIFDYHSEAIRNHQHDWRKMLRWLKRAET